MKVAVNAPGGEIVMVCNVWTRVSAVSVTFSETVKVPDVLNVSEGF